MCVLHEARQTGASAMRRWNRWNSRYLLGLSVFMMGLLAVDSPLQGQTSSANEPPADQSLAFATSSFDDLREGYLSLEWNRVPDATRYEVVDSRGVVAYSGSQNQAFLSGLADGNYLYNVRAYNASDIVIATSKVPAKVTVRHWPAALVAVLFSVGLIVVLAVVIVIVMGTRGEATRKASA